MSESEKLTLSQRRVVVAARRREVCELYCEGWSQRALAKKFKVSRAAIGKDLAAIRRGWQKEQAAKFAEHVAQELAKLQRMEAELWVQWHRSKLDAETVTTERVSDEISAGGATVNGPERIKAVVRKEGRIGDPRIMGELMKVRDRVARLRGLDAPQKVAPTTVDGRESYRPIQLMTDAELLEIAGMDGTEPEGVEEEQAQPLPEPDVVAEQEALAPPAAAPPDHPRPAEPQPLPEPPREHPRLIEARRELDAVEREVRTALTYGWPIAPGLARRRLDLQAEIERLVARNGR